MKRILLACLALAGCGTLPKGPLYDAMTDAEIVAGVTVKGDSLDGYRNADGDAIRPHYPPHGNPASDLYFQARKYDDGRSFVQIVLWVDNTKDWMRPYQINFGSPLRTVDLIRADFDVECYSARTCSHRELMVAPLADADVDWILTQAPDIFDVRIKTRLGDVDRRFRKAELAAVMAGAGLR